MSNIYFLVRLCNLVKLVDFYAIYAAFMNQRTSYSYSILLSTLLLIALKIKRHHELVIVSGGNFSLPQISPTESCNKTHTLASNGLPHDK